MKYDQDFEFFMWTPYPKKIGKLEAYKEWQKLKLTDDEKRDLKDHIEQRKRFDKRWLPNREGNVFIPDPCRFLKHRRFEDEYERVKTAPARPKPQEEVYVPSWKAQGFASPEAYEAHREANREKVSAMLRGALH